MCAFGYAVSVLKHPLHEDQFYTTMGVSEKPQLKVGNAVIKLYKICYSVIELSANLYNSYYSLFIVNKIDLIAF